MTLVEELESLRNRTFSAVGPSTSATELGVILHRLLQLMLDSERRAQGLLTDQEIMADLLPVGGEAVAETWAELTPAEEQARRAPAGKIWQCGICGKTAVDHYGIIGAHAPGYDERCMLKATLVEEK